MLEVMLGADRARREARSALPNAPVIEERHAARVRLAGPVARALRTLADRLDGSRETVSGRGALPLRPRT